MSEIRVHYEGDPQLREGFSVFFRDLINLARERRCHVRFIAGKGGSQTIHDFQDDLKSHSSSWNVLLIDSEGPDDGRLFARLKLPAARVTTVRASAKLA